MPGHDSNIIPFPVRERPVARVEITRADDAGLLQVGIFYYEAGDYVICGATNSLAEALEIARGKAAALGGVQVVDFSGVDAGPPESAA